MLSDCVPSKTFIASAGGRTAVLDAGSLGVTRRPGRRWAVDVAVVHGRVAGLALAQSADIRRQTDRRRGAHRRRHGPAGRRRAGLAAAPGGGDRVAAATETDHRRPTWCCIATGASPRMLPDAVPDGERILTWRQVYSLDELPEHLIVIGSGVTGAEFASAYTEMGVKVTLVSSRDRVLPAEDADAAAVIEQVFAARGSVLAKQARAKSVRRDG